MWRRFSTRAVGARPRGVLTHTERPASLYIPVWYASNIYQGKNAECMLSVEALLQVEEQARAKTVGSAQRVGTVAPVTPKATSVEESH